MTPCQQPQSGMPVYIEGFIHPSHAGYLFHMALSDFPWEERVAARREFFAAPKAGMEYTYGSGSGSRTYLSKEYPTPLLTLSVLVGLGYPGSTPIPPAPLERLWCFCNLYQDECKHLGWHSDNHTGTDHSHGIAVVSLGAARHIWYRTLLREGIPDQEREVHQQLLSPGSLFYMPPGFQATHEHRIPKSDRVVGARVSCTFRVHL